MGNSIALRKAYTQGLDKVYKLSSLTAVLDGPSDLVQAGANANEILIPKLSMDGLADYNKSSGYAQGDVTYAFETKTITYDRGKKFVVDALDDIDTLYNISANGMAEFMRTRVVPELDTWRLASYAQLVPVANTTAANISTGKNAIDAVRAMKTGVKEAEADTKSCYLFISPTVKGLIDDLDTTASKAAMADWAGVIEVPTSRFVTKITLGSNGWTVHQSAADINLLAIPKEAVIQFQKHDVPKIITPEQNQNADAWIFAFRTVGIAEAYDNKKAAMFMHTKA